MVEEDVADEEGEDTAVGGVGLVEDVLVFPGVDEFVIVRFVRQGLAWLFGVVSVEARRSLHGVNLCESDVVGGGVFVAYD